MSRNALAGRSSVAWSGRPSVAWLRRSSVTWAGRSSIAFLAVVACLALTASCALAKAVPRRHMGRLPGFPAIRGVVPALGSPAAVSAHEKLVGEAFAAARAQRALTARGASVRRQRGTPVPSEESLPCVEESEEELTFLTQNVCYRGGPVLHDPTIHLIFWQGSGAEPHVEPFPSGYEATVERYFEGIAHDSGLETNVFAVDSQYGEEQSGGAFHAGEYKLSFDGTNVEVDTSPFPKGGCTDETSFSEGPCLLDSDIQKEVEKVAGPSPKGLGNVYVVLTPPGVGGCFEAESGECAYLQYCAYHSDFGGDGMTPGDQTLYADLPYLGEVPGCDSGVHPNEVTSKTEEKEGRDHGADAVIDTASHELNETITDPIGSQCDEEEAVLGKPEIVGCEKNAWTDAIGQEIADKCLPPESTIFGVYGEPLGELLPGRAASRFNQGIDGGHYWTQRVWSNEAGLLEGGCVQRIIGASFSVSPGIEATVPATLDGSTSGAPGDPATYWAWNFGEGEQIGTASARLSHTFAQPGLYLVGLTAYDANGNARATIEEVEVGPAPVPPSPPPPPPPPTLAPNTIVVKEPIAPVHITAAELATKLGLPPNGKRLVGAGPFALGHAECPPACEVTLQLYAKVASVVHNHRSTKLVLVGSAHMTFAAGGSGALSLSLNTKGAALLRKRHTLAGKLVARVEGQEGGTWQLVRTLTLTDSGNAARRHG
jgi:PKD domain